MISPELKSKLEAIIPIMEGWASPERAIEMANLIVEKRPHLVVEIGVFGGRSLIAQALALKEVGHGHIFGIDPWKPEATLEGENEDNKNWWKTIDLHHIHKLATEAIWNNGVDEYATLIRGCSQHCFHLFQGINIILIDGNHSEIASCRDVQLYLPRVLKGGHIWFDDSDWPSTRKAQDMLEKSCDVVKDSGKYKLYRKR